MSSRDNELGAGAPNALPSRRSLRKTAPQPDASDDVLSELQRPVTEVRSNLGAGTGELRRDRGRLRDASTSTSVDPAVQAWVDRSPLQSIEPTTTGAISLPPVVLPPVTPPAVTEIARVLRSLLAPTKVNLASLGNVVPHLHWHVIARFEGDSHFPAPVWAAAQRLGPADQEAAVHALLPALESALRALLDAVMPVA